jgi:two-component system osmolarity sensor histidine kinase EnvZ
MLPAPLRRFARILFLKKANGTASFLQRIILLILLPMFLMQILSFYIFFRRYWEKVSEKNMGFLVGEIIVLSRRFDERVEGGASPAEIVKNINNYSQIRAEFIGKNDFKRRIVSSDERRWTFLFARQFRKFERKLSAALRMETPLREEMGKIEFGIQKSGGILLFQIDSGKFYTARLDLIIFWNLFSILAISLIAILFAKNQTRSINALKNFVNDFSFLEKENGDFRPTGAKEIRDIGRAFLNMIGKIKHLLNSRTAMLAQVSHDLRTPLTRMKLQTEFIGNARMANFFKKDLEEMDNLINEYISFVRGESDSEYEKINLKKFFSELMEDYRRGGYDNIALSYNLEAGETCAVRELSFRRAINNLLNNSLKYGKKKIALTVGSRNGEITVTVEDDGDGLSAEELERAKKPFFTPKIRGNGSQGGGGLGLPITQQIAAAHRGSLKFFKSKKLGGLGVTITIPISNSTNKKGDKRATRNKK